ncbi:hypothetical protein F0M18_19315 [Pseudohalioglobus sediminis]|uniref:Uncharacterized protein n=1 Tax=Pseudohalioglobus sediminis TaxID=2606449 RepID=A0A5B0WPL9_9GAMM|nr:hypothetical protein [Pseudohalioglobus sediminis]KAA1188185.1 hypothetical protein F0M18_19315 [Pseudohalioglobus sediminis]
MTSEHHIIVPIDLHQISRRNLETLVRIAHLLGRDVLGLMLDDLRLQQVAALPFTTEITLSGARERSLARDHLSQRQLRITGTTRELLLRLAEQGNVKLSFEHAIGHRLHCALESERSVDIFFPPRQQWRHRKQAAGTQLATITRLGLLLPSQQQSKRLLRIATSLVQAGMISEIYALAAGDVRIAELASPPLAGKKLEIRTDMPMNSDSILQLIRRSPYDLTLIPRVCLQDAPPADLDTALSLACGQIMLIGEGD